MSYLVILYMVKSLLKRCAPAVEFIFRKGKKKIHCVKSVRIRSYSGPHFFCIFSHSDWVQRDTPHLLRISPYLIRMWENAEKMRTRITPNTENSYAVIIPNKPWTFHCFCQEHYILVIIVTSSHVLFWFS